MNKKTTVVHYIGVIQDGGAETLVKDYALMLDREKYRVIVVAGYENKNSANSKILREQNVEIKTIFPNDGFITKAILHTIDEVVVCKRLRKILKELKPDVIHVHLSIMRYLIPIIGDFPNTKIVFTCHNLPYLFFDNPKRPKEKKAAQYLIRERNMHIVALHDEMAAEIRELLDYTNVTTVHNGINLDRFQIHEHCKEDLRAKFNIPANAFVIGHVGRFNFQKNHSFLLRVFKKVKEICNEAHLLLVGDGELESQIRGFLKENGLDSSVTILSHRDDIPDLMNIMDVFVFPSIFEGLGIVLIEAQAVGVRCVVSDAVPKEAFVTDNIVALSLEDRVENWAETILNRDRLYSSRPNRLSEYDMKKELLKLEKIYDE